MGFLQRFGFDGRGKVGKRDSMNGLCSKLSVCVSSSPEDLGTEQRNVQSHPAVELTDWEAPGMCVCLLAEEFQCDVNAKRQAAHKHKLFFFFFKKNWAKSNPSSETLSANGKV